MLLSFVEDMDSSTARLELHRAPWRVLASTRFGFPELKRSTSGTSLVDGEVVTADSYGNREIQLRLQVQKSGDPDAALAELQKLHRELNRPRNMLKYQPASTPVWFRTFRAAPESLEIYNAGDYFEVEVNVPAEPFAYGAREVAVNNATVSMNPHAATNPMYVDLTDIKGDVETPIQIAVSGVVFPGFTSAIAIRRRGNPANVPFLLEAEDMTPPTGANTSLQSNSSSMSGSGSNYTATSFGNPENRTRLETSAFPDAASADARGFYRVYGRLGRSQSSSGTIKVQLNANKPVTLPNTTNTQMIELGEVSVPGGMDPVFDGPSGKVLDVQGKGIDFKASRESGSSWLLCDCFLFFPADSESDCFALVTWPEQNTGVHVFDNYSGCIYNLDSNGNIRYSKVKHEGLPLMVSPGVTNRMFFVRKVDGQADAISDSFSVSVGYWPRYLYVAPVEDD